MTADSRFQSTLPARGATKRFGNIRTFVEISIHAPRTGSDSTVIVSSIGWGKISIHAPRTGSDGGFGQGDAIEAISIHAPRTGSDWDDINKAYSVYISIHAPRTGSDGEQYATTSYVDISIHAPRTGSDPFPKVRRAEHDYFNPRSPHGERPIVISLPICSAVFQSTLPARGATTWITKSRKRTKFQSTLPARGATTP